MTKPPLMASKYHAVMRILRARADIRAEQRRQRMMRMRNSRLGRMIRNRGRTLRHRSFPGHNHVAYNARVRMRQAARRRFQMYQLLRNANRYRGNVRAFQSPAMMFRRGYLTKDGYRTNIFK